MHLNEFDYSLPPERIAQEPVTPRDHSRLMVVPRGQAGIEHRRFHQLAEILRPGDLLVLNKTKVLPARLFGKDDSGKKFEVFLLKPIGSPSLRWACLAKPGKKAARSVGLTFAEGVSARVDRGSDGLFEVVFAGLAPSDFLSWLSRHGLPPLPPYLKREASRDDVERYQTVFAKEPGSVAAPTAGLHFTEALLQRLGDRGIKRTEITLHVGYGTFSPIRAHSLDEHEMHEEEYEISDEAYHQMETAKASGGRVIAIGTTSLRAIESIASCGLKGRTRLFLRPGDSFRLANGLITNFHLPKSSLYVLVAAFLGLERTRAAYQEAITEGYRFYSYGDAMAIL